MKELLKSLLVDDISANDFPETRRLVEGLDAKDARFPPLSLMYGETWQRCPEELRALLAAGDPSEHGYQLSAYGDPAFRARLKAFLRESESWIRAPSRFDEESAPLDVAVVWSGTRSALFDFA